MRTATCLSVLALFAVCPSASAQQVNLEGYFVALSDCAANKKKDADNPGNIHVEPMHAYRMLARNATPGTHYLINVPDAPVTTSRWVPMTCGDYATVAAGGAPMPGNGNPPSTTSLAPDSIEYVLAASWQPGFCATAAGEDKDECRTQTASRPDATQFSLHGLWPDDLDDTAIFPCYCNRGAPVSCRGSQPAETSIPISAEVLADLSVLMPGTRSDLHLHEWTKHGTCYEDDRTGADAAADPDEYFSEAMALLTQLNASPVRQLFVDHLGRDVTRQQIESAFDEAFGAGAGERVVIRCDRNRGMITELWIELKGAISTDADLGALILAAPTAETSTDQESCAGGPVVKVK
jgi:ribonuclease T2